MGFPAEQITIATSEYLNISDTNNKRFVKKRYLVNSIEIVDLII